MHVQVGRVGIIDVFRLDGCTRDDKEDGLILCIHRTVVVPAPAVVRCNDEQPILGGDGGAHEEAVHEISNETVAVLDSFDVERVSNVKSVGMPGGIGIIQMKEVSRRIGSGFIFGVLKRDRFF